MSAIGGSKQVGPTGEVVEGGQQAASSHGDVQLPSSAEGTAKQGDPERPSWLPLGYDTPEAFRDAVDKGTYKVGEAPAAAAVEGEVKDPAQALVDDLKTGNLPEIPPEIAAKMAPYSEEFSKTGTLTADARKKAAKDFGVTEQAVDVYLAGLASISTAQTQPFYQMFGGQEAYGQFQKWADTNVSKEETAAFNEALEKSPKAALVMAAQLKQRYAAAGNGEAPRDITRNASQQGASAQRGDTYASTAQMVRDMDDPRYRTDEAFRQAVKEKVARSNNML